MIMERIKTVIAEQFDIDEDDVTTDLKLAELGADIYDKEELVEALSDEFECLIPEDCAESIETVGDAVECVKKHIH